MKVLVVSYSSRADLLFSTPLIRALKVQIDQSEVHVYTRSEYESVVIENPYIDSLHLFNRSAWEKWAGLVKQNYTVVVDLTLTLSGWLLAKSLGKKVLRANRLLTERWWMVNLKINKLPNKHIVLRFLDSVSSLGCKPDELGLDFFIPERDDVPAEWLPEGFRDEWVAVCIQASFATRRLPLTRLIELCDKINKPIIILGQESDAATGEKVEQFFSQLDLDTEWQEGLRALNKRTRVYNACGKFNFNQMASVIRQSRYVFTYDNDMLPVASAFRRETFTIWGNTITLFGRYPYNTKFTVLENNKVSCRPCSSKGFSACPQGHFRCMKDIVFDFYLP